MDYRLENGTLTIWMEGHIDSGNAKAIEDEIQSIRASNPADAVVLDMERVNFISSAGLRIILRMKQAVKNTRISNVSRDVFEIFEMTGFTQIMEVTRLYPTISVEGCEVIGQGANGMVYRFARDTVIKVYKNPDAFSDIQRERELARTAFVLGIPTAIPYDIVKIEGGGYGSVFELLNATNFAKLLIRGEKTVDEIARMSIDLLKIIHEKEVRADAVPSMRETALRWAEFLSDYLPADQYRKLHDLITAIPEDNHLIHGDFHIRNITRQGDENLVLDMDTLSHGNPVFEFGSMFNAYAGFSELDHSAVKRFLGIDYETSVMLWHRLLQLYLGTEDEARIREAENKARILGYTRLLRRAIRRYGVDTEEGCRRIECYRNLLCGLLQETDSLAL